MFTYKCECIKKVRLKKHSKQLTVLTSREWGVGLVVRNNFHIIFSVLICMTLLQ